MGQAIIRFFKSILASFIILVFVTVPCLIFNAFFLSPKWCYVIGAILGAVIATLFYMSAFEGKFFLKDDGKITKAWKANLPLLFHLLIVVAIILFMVFGMDIMNRLHKETPILTIICVAIGALIPAQLGYYIFLRISHHDKTCPHCKHIYCLKYGKYLGSEVTKGNQYKTETSEKEVGGIYVGSSKIGSINASNSTQYSREVTRTTERHKYYCTKCGNAVIMQETITKYSNWQ